MADEISRADLKWNSVISLLSGSVAVSLPGPSELEAQS